MRVLPRLVIILLVFVGLNWWVGRQKQMASPQTPTTEMAKIWDEDQPRKPGSAIAILLDQQKPDSLSPEAFTQWQDRTRTFLEAYYGKIIQAAGKHNELPVRVGLYRSSPGVTDTQAGMSQTLSPPSHQDVKDAFDANQWHGQRESLDLAMRQAIKALSDSGLQSTMLLVIRYPLLETQESAYQFAARWRPALLPPPDGPRIVVDMELLKSASASDPQGPTMRALLRLAFPGVELDEPPATSPAAAR